MKKILSLATASACLVLTELYAADAAYINYGSTNNPQIDARVVVNYGTIQASDMNLFGTQSTQYLTNQNSGTFSGYPGFIFDYATESGRGPAVNFVNKGTIEANGDVFSYLDSLLGSSVLGPTGYLEGSYILVSSANIQNPGLLTTDDQGLIRLDGSTVDLTRGGLRAGQSATQSDISGRGTLDGTNYTNPTGVLDSYARINTNQVAVAELATRQGFKPFAYTNKVTDSNFIVQVVWLSTNNVDSNIVASVRFTPPSNTRWPGVMMPDMINDGAIAVVEMGMTNLDIISGQPFTNFVYVLDTACLTGPQTNWSMTTNRATIPRIGTRPIPFEVTRSTPRPEWAAGTTNYTPYTNTLLTAPFFANTVVTNLFASYTFQVGIPVGQNNLASDPLSPYESFMYLYNDVGIQESTNWPGRIEVEATRLNLNQARLRGESSISIKANQLVQTNSPMIDAPHLFLDVDTPTGLLVVSNFVVSAVKRLSGSVSVETHLYTNQIMVAITNTPEGEGAEPTVETNYLDVKTHVCIVDYTGLKTDATVVTDVARLRTSKLVLYDTLNVDRSLLIEASNLRNAGQIVLFDQLYELGSANLPNLINFTNEGLVSVPEVAYLGADRGSGLQNMINRGLISAGAIQYRAKYFDNSGTNYADTGPINIEATAAKLDDGLLAAASSITLMADDLKARNSMLVANGLTLDVNSIADGGSNLWVTGDGFRLARKPEVGDLFGFEVVSVPAPFVQVRHVWSANNRGNTPAGYTNNAVIGQLYLEPTNFSSFYFEGTGQNQALYVDYLSITNVATNALASTLEIAPGFMVYFADCNLPVELVDGLSNGRLRWCRDFAGPYSSIAITNSLGFVNYYNRALRYSATIDSDGDGRMNAVDTSPFDGVKIKDIDVVLTPKPSAYISWLAVTQTLYSVQYATNLVDPKWLVLTNFTFGAPSNSTVTVQDLLPKNPSQRYYQVLYAP